MAPAGRPDSEFGFELRLCAWAERAWPPEGTARGVPLVARQLGTRKRRWDTVIIEADPEGFRRRAAFGPRRLDSDLLHVARNAPADWAWYRDALPDPGYPWRYVREAVHRADSRGIIDTRRNGNRIELQRTNPYPDWVRHVVAIENKPDLDASAARDLGQQLERDVALALADEVWVATNRTGEQVEPILLSDAPVEAGVLVVEHGDRGDQPSVRVAWRPATLAADEAGTRIVERGAEKSRFESVPPEEKHRRRLLIAERAYERGWRAYQRTMRPDCRHFHLRRAGDGYVPWCGAKGREQTAGECAGSCADFEPEPPVWRTGGWPIEGGPGACIKRVLAERRERRRPE